MKLKTFAIWVVLVGACFAILILNDDKNRRSDADPISSDAVTQLIEDGEVESWALDRSGIFITTIDGIRYLAPKDVVAKLSQSGVPMSLPVSERDESAGSGPLKFVLITAAVLAVLYFVLKKMGGGGVGGNVFELKKTKARQLEAASQVRFDQVGGNTEAVEALQDVVDFMKDPAPWTAIGARVPRGILLVGPPGTGKTLMARAVAGETNASFFYTSATEFVEMFVGVGAARVRDTFEKAAKAQPAVIFIDEIDAIGRKRSSGMGTMHEEREQTLNQLLVLMDGLERFDRLVVIAATNRPDVLDPALMRSGRFDRIIRMVRPADVDRAAILAIHMKPKPMEPTLTAEQLVPHTQGLTGADIETVLNEAAILAIRRSRGNRNSSAAASIRICEQDVIDAVAKLKQGNRQFNTLDSVIVESVTQLSEPTGRAVARITTIRGQVIEGDIIWMNSQFVKLKSANGDELVLARENIEQIEALDGTEMTAVGDTTADRWTRPNLDVG